MKATIVRPAPVPQPPVTVTLEMTMEEAEIVKTTLGTIQGSGNPATLKITNDAFYVLHNQGVKTRPSLFTNSLVAK